MKKSYTIIATLAVLAMGCVFTGSTDHACPEGTRPTEALKAFLAPYHGKVLLLLMGREGCPGTVKATAALHDYALTKPERVEILRLDVPLPDENLELMEEWTHTYPRKVDIGRKIGEAVGFFYYPTFFVFDQEGALRYSGGCDAAKLDAMVKEILAESPGQPKKLFSLPMPKEGEQAPDFTGTDLKGQPVTLASLKGKKATFLVFAQTSCSFTIDAFPTIQTVALSFRAHDVTLAVINSGEELEIIQPIYATSLSTIPVVWDKGGQISKQYGVDVSPFFFLLDQDGKVVKRGAFTGQASMSALSALLNRSVATPIPRSKEAG